MQVGCPAAGGTPLDPPQAGAGRSRGGGRPGSCSRPACGEGRGGVPAVGAPVGTCVPRLRRARRGRFARPAATVVQRRVLRTPETPGAVNCLTQWEGEFEEMT